MTRQLAMRTFDAEGPMVSGDKPFGPRAFEAKLARLHDLSDDDVAALGRLPVREAVIDAGQGVLGMGGDADHCAVILEGLAFGYKLTGRRDRQITCFHLAGDMPDLQGLYLGRTDIGVGTVTGCRVGYVPHVALRDLCSHRPGLMEVLWRETLVQAAIMREWLLNVGRRDALARLAHLMCEMVFRQRLVGLTSDHSCSFPLTQASLADAISLSPVHVNRVLQKVRASKLVEWEDRRLTVLDWDRLCAVADFDPAYLHAYPKALASSGSAPVVRLRKGEQKDPEA